MRIVAHFYPCCFVLHGILPYHGCVCETIILREIADIYSEFGLQHPCYAEIDVEIGIDVEFGQWEDVIVGTRLVGEFVVPIKDAEMEFVLELSRNDLEVFAALSCGNAIENEII